MYGTLFASLLIVVITGQLKTSFDDNKISLTHVNDISKPN